MLNLTAFKDLVHTSRMKIDNFANNGKDKLSRAKAASVWRLYTETHNGDIPIPDFTSVEDNDGKVIEELSLDKNELSDKNPAVVLNWLVKLMKYCG